MSELLFNASYIQIPYRPFQQICLTPPQKNLIWWKIYAFYTLYFFNNNNNNSTRKSRPQIMCRLQRLIKLNPRGFHLDSKSSPLNNSWNVIVFDALAGIVELKEKNHHALEIRCWRWRAFYQKVDCWSMAVDTWLSHPTFNEVSTHFAWSK